MVNPNINKFFLWRDSVIYLGESFDPDFHRHHAVQCCISLTAKLKIRWDGVEQWRECTAAIIGANVTHSITCPDGPVCLLYLEKSSNNYQTILDYHCIDSSCQTKKEPLLLTKPIPTELTRSLLSARTSNVNTIIANQLKQQCLKVFNGYISSQNKLDLRIAKLLKLLHCQPEQSFLGCDLAQNINLSESRMQHLFKQQVGIPIRRYILWMKLRHVLELAFAGTSLTEAAHATGFSDSAHFSRTFKATFGITPSLLVNTSNRSIPLFCD